MTLPASPAHPAALSAPPWRALTLAVLPVFFTAPAFAHSTERGLILLLPTGYYIAGAVLAVAASFLAAAFLPPARLRRAMAWRRPLPPLPHLPGRLASWAGFFLLALLVMAGFTGSRDPLSNPLPPVLWGLFWVGLPMAHALGGNLWGAVNPWSGPAALLAGLARRCGRRLPRLRYPAWLGCWPAVALLFAFAWLELVDPAPRDPARLALMTLLWFLLNLTAMLLFGERRWLARGEAFALFFRLAARLAPLAFHVHGRRWRVTLRAPGAGLLRPARLPAGYAAFILLALAAVSFDGLSKTFFWLGLFGVNPLDYPGRSALMAMNGGGLAGTFLLLLALFRLSGLERGRLALALVPVAFGYHLAHYLTLFLLDAQYAWRALSDPFARGWDLFGASGGPVVVSFLSRHDSVEAIWTAQVVIIAIAHILAVLAERAAGTRRFMPVRMFAILAWTAFGLWLLSTPAAG